MISSIIDKILGMTINNLKDVFNILFFIIMATVSILSYLKARKTILQPMRNEVFKQQLKIFSEIMEVFNGKSESDLRRFFGISKLFDANVALMLDKYLISELGYKPTGKRPYNQEVCPGSIMTQDFIDKNIQSTEYNFESNKTENNINWDNYKHGEIKVPDKTWKALSRIDKLIKSPLLPKKCINELVSIKKLVHQNIFLVGKILSSVSKELPKKYKNKEDFLNLETIWIWNKYNREFENLEEPAEELASYLREYLQVDSLLN